LRLTAYIQEKKAGGQQAGFTEVRNQRSDDRCPRSE
jgi:hypothetical protein